MYIPENIREQKNQFYTSQNTAGYTDKVGGFHQKLSGVAPDGHQCTVCQNTSCEFCPEWWMRRREQYYRKREQKRAEIQAEEMRMSSLKQKLLPFVFCAFSSAIGASLLFLHVVALDSPIHILSFLFSLFLFSDMVYEDYRYQTVSLQKSVVLALGLCACSVSALQGFLFLFIFYLLFFHVVLMLLSISTSLYLSRPKKVFRKRPGEFILSGRTSFKSTGIPFLPCFASGVILVAFASLCIPLPDVVVSLANKLFDLNTLLLSVTWQPTLLGILLTLLLLLTIVQSSVKSMYEFIPVMGEGDALVLPIFGAFLGTPLFFFSLAMGFGVALGTTARK